MEGEETTRGEKKNGKGKRVKQGENEKAKDLLLEILNDTKETGGNDDPIYLTDRANLAMCYKNMKNYDEAVNIYKDVLEMQEKRLGKTHTHYKETQGNYLRVLEAKKI